MKKKLMKEMVQKRNYSCDIDSGMDSNVHLLSENTNQVCITKYVSNTSSFLQRIWRIYEFIYGILIKWLIPQIL